MEDFEARKQELLDEVAKSKILSLGRTVINREGPYMRCYHSVTINGKDCEASKLITAAEMVHMPGQWAKYHIMWLANTIVDLILA